MIFEEYMTLWHLQLLGLYIVANCALPWYIIWKLRRLQPDSERDKEKFLPWVRDDAAQWSYLLCIFTHFFFLARYFLMFITLTYAMIFVVVVQMGSNPNKLGSFRRWLILQHTCLMIRILVLVMGNFVSTRRPEVDYRKWLGPDWKPTYEGASMIVSNHQGWQEVLHTILYVRPLPGFIAKETVKRIPGVGLIATVMGTVFLNRMQKETRQQVFQTILER